MSEALAQKLEEYRRRDATKAMLGVAGPLNEFIQEAIDDERVRRQRTEALRAQAQSFSYPDFTPTTPS